MFVFDQCSFAWITFVLNVKVTFSCIFNVFFAAGRSNYARYGWYYYDSMLKLPVEIKEKFMLGLHVVRLTDGIWNGIWADQAIESTLMKKGSHSQKGLVSKSTNERLSRQWALNQSILSEINTNFEEFNDRKPTASKHFHKEELPGRIKADSADRENIKTKLGSCINPLSTEEHPQGGIVNIENGRVYSSATTNVDNAVATGSKQLQDFINKLPNSFNEPIKIVTTLMMDNQFKSAVIVKVVSIEKILGQLLLLQQNGEDMKVILRCYELFPLPLSMFQKNGKSRQT